MQRPALAGTDENQPSLVDGSHRERLADLAGHVLGELGPVGGVTSLEVFVVAITNTVLVRCRRIL